MKCVLIFVKIYDRIKEVKGVKESEEKAMIENENIKEKLNMINMKNTRRIIKIAETRMAVHTHTHTHTCLLVNNFASKLANIKKNIESLVEDRTVLWNSIVLSLSAFISKNGRDGPVYE